MAAPSVMLGSAGIDAEMGSLHCGKTGRGTTSMSRARMARMSVWKEREVAREFLCIQK